MFVNALECREAKTERRLLHLLMNLSFEYELELQLHAHIRCPWTYKQGDLLELQISASLLQIRYDLSFTSHDHL